MADIVKRFLKQDCVYWPPAGEDDHGTQQFWPARQLKCRWEDRQELYLDARGQQQVSNAMVIVAEDVLLDGVLWLGGLDDLENNENPFANVNAYAIKKFNKVPDIRAKYFARTAVL